MQRITLLVLILFSQTIFSSTKITETEKLATTCKVWGFLKYYHPKVAGGEVNWDKQLLEKLPLIKKAQTKEEFSIILEKWIDDLGPVKEIAPIAAPKDVTYFDKNFDLSWINSNKLFSKKLSKKLKFIEENRFQGKQFYVEGMEVVGNIHLINESNLNPDYNDANSKLRVTFMYWNLIEYFFPYKYKMDENWDTALEKVIPQVIASKDDVEFLTAMRKLAYKLNDSHVEFFVYQSTAPKKDWRYFPANGRIIDEKFVVTEILGDSLAQAYDIKIGTEVTKINHKKIKEIVEENRGLIGASNESKYLDKLRGRLLSSESDTVEVEFLEDGKYVSKTMFWGDYHDSHRNEFKKGAKKKKKEKFKLLESNIGYVDMGILKPENVPDMINMMKSTKAIVFDLRNYPQGTIREISDFINPHEKTFAIYTVPDLTYPGKYTWSAGSKSGFENKDNYKGKVIVLINEQSISHSEWSAMCFQGSGNATLIGSQTAGADGNISQFYFEGFSTIITGIGVYYPDKKETQRIGIVPDIEVKPTIKGIQEGKDEVLDRALLFVETGK